MPVRAAPPIDFPRLLVVAGGDRRLAAQLVGVYLEQVPTLVAQIASALVGRDGGALRRAAQALKGSLLSLAADEAAAAAAANALEFLGPNRGWLPEAVAARRRAVALAVAALLTSAHDASAPGLIT